MIHKRKDEIAEQTFNGPEKALLIATYSGEKNLNVCREHLQELSLLARTYGLETAEMLPTGMRKVVPATYFNNVILEGLVEKAKELQVDVVIIDEEITPAQQRNLEKAFGANVIDRTELILGVFSQRAQTKEAKLQVELAELRYQKPRLKRLWTHLERQAATGSSGGGGAYLRSMGEKQIEVDKRLVQKDIDKVRKEIKEVREHRETQRQKRKKQGIPVFAIVGYTNAGKSTLLNALTDADVLIEDKLFATLDTTTRQFELRNHQKVLLIDTVGFIRKLPHLLVAAFKSTLEEAIKADVLIHLIDVSHPMAEEQARSSYEVLEELNAEDKPIITLLNKIDQCEDQSLITRLRFSYPKTVLFSASSRTGFDELEERMVEELRKTRSRVKLKIPQSDYGCVSHVMEMGNVYSTEYEENDVIIDVDLPNREVGQLNKYVL